MKRSRIENNDLLFNIRINGRIYAAFRNERIARNEALRLINVNPEHTVELSTQNDVEIIKQPGTPKPVDKLFAQ